MLGPRHILKGCCSAPTMTITEGLAHKAISDGRAKFIEASRRVQPSTCNFYCGLGKFASRNLCKNFTYKKIVIGVSYRRR